MLVLGGGKNLTEILYLQPKKQKYKEIYRKKLYSKSMHFKFELFPFQDLKC